MDDERAYQQQKFANSQKKWLLILNVLLGSSVIFTIVDRLKTNYPVIPGSNNIIEIFKSQFYTYSEPLILVFLGIIGVIGAIGLAYNFLKHQVGFSTLFKKMGLNKAEES